MAYSTSNPPYNLVQGLPGTAAIRFWVYKSADAIADVNTDGYFTNGYQLGMQALDPILVIDTATPTATLAVVRSVSATTGVADISDGTAVSVTDSD